MRSAIVLGGVGLVIVGLAVACGDDDASIPSPTDAGSSLGDASSTSPTSDAMIEEPAPVTPYTLDDVCDRTAPIICELRKPCCTTYDEAGCRARQNTECAKDVAAARAGTETFHPEVIYGCIPKYRDLLAQCTFSWDLLQKVGTELGACQAFTGKKAVGDACERTAECLPGTKASDLTTCDDKTKKCKVLTFLVEGDACTLAEGTSGICSSGLYCDVDFSKAGLTGFCKKATSLGVPCDPEKKPFNLECGIGNFCDHATKKCVVGKSAGAECTGPNLECQSLSCSKGDAGVCDPVDPITKPVECTGP